MLMRNLAQKEVKPMKVITWNVNGLRACLGKGFLEFCREQDPDMICLQETKMQEGQAEVDLPGYVQYWNSAEKKGYSGTAIFTKMQPLSNSCHIAGENHDQEGRVITLEYEDFYLVTVYTPNAKDGLARLDYRMVWDQDFLLHLKALDEKKPVIACGDFNVAHQEIDLKNPKSNHNSPGFSDEEREKMTTLLSAGFTDAFRYLYPDQTGAYTWWSYRFKARANNAGWRIDYFLVSDRIREKIADVVILSEVTGSDHCPVLLQLK